MPHVAQPELAEESRGGDGAGRSVKNGACVCDLQTVQSVDIPMGGGVVYWFQEKRTVVVEEEGKREDGGDQTKAMTVFSHARFSLARACTFRYRLATDLGVRLVVVVKALVFRR